jgi:diguanylate cyclase (GGDEF)-like protein/PAS domain S-box-containing protein
VIIMLAGWLYSVRVTIVLAGLTGLMIAGLVLAEVLGLAPALPPTSPVVYGVIAGLVNAMATLMVVFLVRFQKNQLDELQASAVSIAQRTAELETTQARLEMAIKASKMVFWQYDVANDQLHYDAALLRWMGLPGEQGPRTLAQWVEQVHPDDQKTFEDCIARAKRAPDSQGPALDFEYRLATPTHGWVWVHTVGAVVQRDAAGLALTVGGGATDISVRKKAEDELRLAASVFAHAREAIMITTVAGEIVDVNKTFTRITGYERDEVLGKNPRIMSSGRHERDFYATLWTDLTRQGHWVGEVWNRRKSGEVFAVMQTISAVRDAHGDLLHYVSLFSDITAQKEHQHQLEHIAHYDALTNLPNRALLADRLQQGLAQTQRRGQFLAVAYLDLDGFKGINDNHGHDAGDQLLITLANRMKQALREGDTLARIGGDEFVAVLGDLPDVTASEPMLSRLLVAAAQPVHVGSQTLQVSASLGVTFYPQSDDVDADHMLRQADQAMYQAKLAGKNRYHVFDAEQDRSVRGHHESLEHIRSGLARQEFVLHYQPKVNMRTGKVIGAEALIRWQHPLRGLLAPGAFLPVIEQHPMAVDLGEWVIEAALIQMEQWRALGLDMPVSVNVGAHQLQQTNFAHRLQAMLAAHPTVKPASLGLELRETSALQDIANVSSVMEACHRIGVNFALDDFGTGYSSLTYLKRLPATLLKIDQSFVRDMLDDPEDLAILEGIIGLASAFGRDVIAEGMETLDHGCMLLQLGCEQAQGYGIARPMPADAMPEWVRDWRLPVHWETPVPISRDDFPLLFANAQHRAWLTALETFCRGSGEAPPEMDHRQCQFGRWLHTAGKSRYSAHTHFTEVVALHQEVHKLANALLRLKANGHHAQALQKLDEIGTLGDAMLARMKGLARDG